MTDSLDVGPGDVTVEGVAELLPWRPLEQTAAASATPRWSLPLRDLAAAVGVSWMAINRWENGSMPRSAAHLRAYARLLDELERLRGSV